MLKKTRDRTHVNGHVVVHAENDFWTTIESRLDVGVDCED